MVYEYAALERLRPRSEILLEVLLWILLETLFEVYLKSNIWFWGILSKKTHVWFSFTYSSFYGSQYLTIEFVDPYCNEILSYQIPMRNWRARLPRCPQGSSSAFVSWNLSKGIDELIEQHRLARRLVHLITCYRRRRWWGWLAVFA